MSKKVNTNDVADFFGALGALGQIFGAALDNYINENYDEVETPDEQGDETEEHGDVEDSCCDECYCGDCEKECDCECDDVDEAGPAGPAEEHDAYKLIISDYSVTTYEAALKIMTPKLNALTFAMRTFAFGDAAVEFRFKGVTYRFFWDRPTDAFIGLEDNNVITKEVYWDEISGQVKDINVEEPAVEEEQKEEIKPNGVPGTECKYKGEAFYPYGKNCEECPHKNECFTSEDAVEEDHESCSATYAADGDAIADEEIPSLKDYVGKESTVQSEPGYDSGYGEIPGVSVPDFHETPVEDSKITGRTLYDKLNNRFKPTEDAVIESLLVGVKNLLAEDDFDVDNSDPNDTDIHRIKFNLEKIKKHMSAAYKDNVENLFHMQNLVNAIKDRFQFTEVFVYENTIFCELI